MAPTFTVSIDLAGYANTHAPTAVRHTIAELLDQAKQAFVSGAATRGDLTISRPNTPIQVLGTWSYVDRGVS